VAHGAETLAACYTALVFKGCARPLHMLQVEKLVRPLCWRLAFSRNACMEIGSFEECAHWCSRHLIVVTHCSALCLGWNEEYHHGRE
jgi:hypothetical protein